MTLWQGVLFITVHFPPEGLNSPALPVINAVNWFFGLVNTRNASQNFGALCCTWRMLGSRRRDPGLCPSLRVACLPCGCLPSTHAFLLLAGYHQILLPHPHLRNDSQKIWAFTGRWLCFPLSLSCCLRASLTNMWENSGDAKASIPRQNHVNGAEERAQSCSHIRILPSQNIH